MTSGPVAPAAAEKTVLGADTETGMSEAPEPYTVFTRLEKYCIIVMVSCVSWSANLSTFIFLPALKPLSVAFEVSVNKINLIITVYMAVGAVVPLFVGDAADVLGRRAAYVVTLSLFTIANLCLALADSYEVFLGLRMLQAVGQSGAKYLKLCNLRLTILTAQKGRFLSGTVLSVISHLQQTEDLT
jgi:MFS family permease